METLGRSFFTSFHLTHQFTDTETVRDDKDDVISIEEESELVKKNTVATDLLQLSGLLQSSFP